MMSVGSIIVPCCTISTILPRLVVHQAQSPTSPKKSHLDDIPIERERSSVGETQNGLVETGEAAFLLEGVGRGFSVDVEGQVGREEGC